MILPKGNNGYGKNFNSFNLIMHGGIAWQKTN